MLPTISQQIQSMKTRMEETIVPELPASATFAREQAAFIVMTLEWMLDTHEHQYRYEVVENLEYRRLLADMIELGRGSEIDEDLLSSARQTLSEPGPAADEAAVPLRSLIDRNRQLKRLAAKLYTSFSAKAGPRANPARHLFVRVALDQGNRELAFFRRTGFANSPVDLGAALAGSKDGSGGSEEAHTPPHAT